MSKDIITEEKAEELYREMLDDNYPVKIGDLNYNASNVLEENVLEEVDPTAYRCGLGDYIDSLTDDYLIEGINASDCEECGNVFENDELQDVSIDGNVLSLCEECRETAIDKAKGKV